MSDMVIKSSRASPTAEAVSSPRHRPTLCSAKTSPSSAPSTPNTAKTPFFSAHWLTIFGQGVGLQGNTYAIPTMQGGLETIKPYVDEFIDFAKSRPDLTFYVTKIGCGIAGFTFEEIAPLFSEAVGESNVRLPKEFVEIINSNQPQ